MTAIEDDEKVSICLVCARHPSLNANIAAKTISGICASCCREDAPVLDRDNLEPMTMLLRAPVRFSWDEEVYNPHWGGENVLDLFSDDTNPVVKPQSPVAISTHSRGVRLAAIS